MEETHMTIGQLAARYQVSVSTVRGWIRTGVIPIGKYIKVGRTFRFLPSEIDPLLRADITAQVKQETPQITNPDVDM